MISILKFQKYPFNKIIIITLSTLIAIIVLLFSPQYFVLSLITLMLLFVLIKRKSRIQERINIRIIETQRINRESYLHLISYKNKNILLFSTKNCALKILEEEDNV